MASPMMQRKSARLDLRITEDQKREIEAAASLMGISVSQWSVASLLDAARDVFLKQQKTQLSRESFDAFAKALEEPVSDDFLHFMDGSTRWNQ